MIAQCQDSFDIGINTLKQQAGSLDEMKAELSSVLQSGDNSIYISRGARSDTISVCSKRYIYCKICEWGFCTSSYKVMRVT